MAVQVGGNAVVLINAADAFFYICRNSLAGGDHFFSFHDEPDMAKNHSLQTIHLQSNHDVLIQYQIHSKYNAKRLNELTARHGKRISELWDVTCHMVLHNVGWHY